MEERVIIMDSIDRIIEYLFNRDWEEDLTEEQTISLQTSADNLIAKRGWKNVFESAVDYLHTKCVTPESVINFAHRFFQLFWNELPIPNPHEFLAYFYYRINDEVEKYDDVDILNSLAISILPKAGYREADLYLNPSYMPESDPKIRAEVEKLKKQNG